MVWPAKVYDRTFDGVIQNYTEAAKINQALLFPVGVVWRAYQKHPQLESLYGYDHFHPSPVGSFLAALTIFHKLYPAQNLSKLQLKHCRQWIAQQATLDTMIRLVQEY